MGATKEIEWPVNPWIIIIGLFTLAGFIFYLGYDYKPKVIVDESRFDPSFYTFKVHNRSGKFICISKTMKEATGKNDYILVMQRIDEVEFIEKKAKFFVEFDIWDRISIGSRYEIETNSRGSRELSFFTEIK